VAPSIAFLGLAEGQKSRSQNPKINGDHGRTRAPTVFVSTPIGSTDCKSRIDGQLAHSLTGPIPSAPARSCLESPPAATAG
jgi:hypothetical protein